MIQIALLLKILGGFVLILLAIASIELIPAFIGRLFVRKDKSYSGHFRPRSTPEASKLGEYLRSFGWNVELEKSDNHKHIDIAITEAKVNIEVDGGQHSYDAQ